MSNLNALTTRAAKLQKELDAVKGQIKQALVMNGKKFKPAPKAAANDVMDDKLRARLVKMLQGGSSTEQAANNTGCTRQQAAAVKAWLTREGKKYAKSAAL